MTAIIISIAAAILFIIAEEYLSLRQHFLFGLIVPALILAGSIYILIFIATQATLEDWLYRLFILFCLSLLTFFDGRKHVKNKMKKELEKMKVKDL